MAFKQPEEFCSECGANATWYCVQDDASFCDCHNTVAHSLKSQKSHKIVPIGEKDLVVTNEVAKPANCRNHHMPLCLYCLTCKDVCCVACLSVDIHKQHSDQVKSVVDVANGERKLLSEYIEKIQKLHTVFADEHKQLQQALKDIDITESRSSQEIDKEFDRIQAYVEARRNVLKEQLQKQSRACRENMCSRQEDLKNIDSSLNRCLEEGRHVSTLNDFAALSQSKAIIEKLKKVETESVEYQQQPQLIDSIRFYISSQALLEMIKSMGAVGVPPAPSFIEEKCKAGDSYLDIEWKPIECNPPVTAYILEIGQNDHAFREVYRGFETQFHLENLNPNTSYVFRLCVCNEAGIGSTASLELRTLNFDLSNWTLSMSSPYETLAAENTRESLLDGQLTTGAAACSGRGLQWIQATFPYPIPVASVTIAPLHKNPNKWNPTSGSAGTLQYSHDNTNWTTVGSITYVNMQQQKLETGGITARYWRLSRNSALGTSSFVFK